MPITDENVTPFPNPLVRRAVKAQEAYAIALKEAGSGRQRAIHAVIDYGAALLEGREEHKSNLAFKAWVADNGLDAGDPWSKVRERSEAMTIAVIFRTAAEDSPFTDCPTTRPSHIMKWYRKLHPSPETKQKAEATAKATAAIKTLEALGETVTEDKIAERAGVSAGTANKAFTIHRKTREAAEQATAETTLRLTEDQLLARADAAFSGKSKVTVEHAIAIHKKRLDKVFWAAVQDEVHKAIAKSDDAVRKSWNELRPRFDALERRYNELQRVRGVFTRAEFRQLLMCCHPDASAGPEIRARLTDILVKNEAKLIKGD